MTEKIAGKPPKFWVGVAYVASSVVLLLVILFYPSPLSLEDISLSVVLALMPTVLGIDEFTRYFRWQRNRNVAVAGTKMQENTNKSLPKSHFWIFGIGPILLVIVTLSLLLWPWSF